jgi:hypothetical protein
MARSNATGCFCSSNSLHVLCPLPLLLHNGIIGLSALCEASCGQHLLPCFLSLNDTFSPIFQTFSPAQQIQLVVRMANRVSPRISERLGWRRMLDHDIFVVL